ncbi:MAG TPA: DHA2 family efflux MFS transporter permease subunit [Stellaceae bacterium]
MPRPPRQFLIPMIVACALFMENLDSTIISTALPSIAHALNEDPVRLNVAITSYLLSLAVFIPASGWFADRFGARTVFRTAIVVFTLGSIGCGFAHSLWQLVGTRILQGMGGAMMVPVGRLVMMRAVPKSDLVRAMTYLTVPALIGPVTGPVLGGFIVTYFSWRWIFFINIPMGILGFVLASIFIDNIREPDAHPLDWRGFILCGLGLAGVVFGFETAGRGAIPGSIVVALLVSGALLLVLYVLHARRTAFPLIDLGLLKIPTYFAGVVGGSFFRIGVGAMPFLTPLMFQLGFGMSALNSGLLTFAGAMGAMLMKTTAGPIIRTFGFRHVLIGNAFIASAFLFALALFRPATPHYLIFGILLCGGFFRSLQFTSVNTLAYADVPAARMSRATSLQSMGQQLAMSIGVGTGALALHLTLLWHGSSSLAAEDFTPAFIAVSVISISCVFFFINLSPYAGAEVSGHKARVLAASEQQAGD